MNWTKPFLYFALLLFWSLGILTSDHTSELSTRIKLTPWKIVEKSGQMDLPRPKFVVDAIINVQWHCVTKVSGICSPITPKLTKVWSDLRNIGENQRHWLFTFGKRGVRRPNLRHYFYKLPRRIEKCLMAGAHSPSIGIFCLWAESKSMGRLSITCPYFWWSSGPLAKQSSVQGIVP